MGVFLTCEQFTVDLGCHKQSKVPNTHCVAATLATFTGWIGAVAVLVSAATGMPMVPTVVGPNLMACSSGALCCIAKCCPRKPEEHTPDAATATDIGAALMAAAPQQHAQMSGLPLQYLHPNSRINDTPSQNPVPSPKEEHPEVPNQTL